MNYLGLLGFRETRVLRHWQLAGTVRVEWFTVVANRAATPATAAAR